MLKSIMQKNYLSKNWKFVGWAFLAYLFCLRRNDKVMYFNLFTPDMIFFIKYFLICFSVGINLVYIFNIFEK